MVAWRRLAAVMTLAIRSAEVAAAAGSHEFGGAGNGTGQAIMLLQVSAQALSTSPSLPSVSQMTGGASKVFEQMNSQVGTLELQLMEVQKQNANELAEKKSEHAQELEAQQAEIHRIEEQNAKIDASLSALNKENAHLRRQASALQKDGGDLRTEMRAVLANFTTSREFASASLDHFSDVAVNLSVLQEVDAEEAAVAAHEEHTKRFDSILGGEMKAMRPDEGAKSHLGASFLQLDAQPAHAATAMYKRLLSGLEEGFDALAKEHEENQAALKKRFDEDMRAAAGRQSVLLAAHESLTASEAAATELRTRLQAAVQRLQQTKAFLQERILALRAYAGRLGSGAVAR